MVACDAVAPKHCAYLGCLKPCVFSSVAFSGVVDVWIFVLAQRNLQSLRLAYQAEKATPWPFHSGIFIISNMPAGSVCFYSLPPSLRFQSLSGWLSSGCVCNSDGLTLGSPS